MHYIVSFLPFICYFLLLFPFHLLFSFHFFLSFVIFISFIPFIKHNNMHHIIIKHNNMHDPEHYIIIKHKLLCLLCRPPVSDPLLADPEQLCILRKGGGDADGHAGLHAM